MLATLGAAGADRVFWYSLGATNQPADWAPIEAIVRTADRLPVSLVMMEKRGESLAQSFADRLQGTRLSDARVETHGGELRVTDASGATAHLDGIPLVCEIASGRYAPAVGGDEIEVMYSSLDEVITEKALPQAKEPAREATLELPAMSLPDSVKA